MNRSFAEYQAALDSAQKAQDKLFTLHGSANGFANAYVEDSEFATTYGKLEMEIRKMERYIQNYQGDLLEKQLRNLVESDARAREYVKMIESSKQV